jgi:toxin CcdB
MAQFDLYKNPRGGVHPLLLDVQSDVLAQLKSRIVVPLARRDRILGEAFVRANPVVDLEGVSYVLMFPLLASVPRSILAKPISSLAARRAELFAAIDLVFTGS